MKIPVSQNKPTVIYQELFYIDLIQGVEELDAMGEFKNGDKFRTFLIQTTQGVTQQKLKDEISKKYKTDLNRDIGFFSLGRPKHSSFQKPVWAEPAEFMVGGGGGSGGVVENRAPLTRGRGGRRGRGRGGLVMIRQTADKTEAKKRQKKDQSSEELKKKTKRGDKTATNVEQGVEKMKDVVEAETEVAEQKNEEQEDNEKVEESSDSGNSSSSSAQSESDSDDDSSASSPETREKKIGQLYDSEDRPVNYNAQKNVLI